MDAWNPDPAVLRSIETALRKISPNELIAVGARIVTQQELMLEIRQGTDFGKDYLSDAGIDCSILENFGFELQNAHFSDDGAEIELYTLTMGATKAMEQALFALTERYRPQTARKVKETLVRI